jgi:hypothetical protein
MNPGIACNRIRVPNVSSFVRKSFVAIFGTALLAWLVLTPLVACPFLQAASARPAAPCCPASHAPKPHCPLSPTIETCPFFVTEAKIGSSDIKIQTVSVERMVSAVALPAGELTFAFERFEDYLPDRAESYLRNRVLRI